MVSSYRKGLWAEALSRFLLRMKGYRIVAARYRSGQGEIDIVAARGSFLVFIEVKARASTQEASDAIAKRQRERLRRAARAFLSRHPQYNQCLLRFDAVLAVPWRLPKHIKGAWDGEDG